MTRCDYCLVEIEQSYPGSRWYDANDPDNASAIWCPQSPDYIHHPEGTS